MDGDAVKLLAKRTLPKINVGPVGQAPRVLRISILGDAILALEHGKRQ